MTRVFCFEETHLDISGLRMFGEISYVFYNKENRRPLRDEKLEEQIVSQLGRFKFNPEQDYIAIVGQQLPIAIFISAVISAYGSVKALCFEAREGGYYERTLGSLEGVMN